MPAKRKRPSTSNAPPDDNGDASQAECPFTVDYRQTANRTANARRTKRTKTSSKPGGPPPKHVLDKQDFTESPTVMRIIPEDKWNELKKYRNFVVGTETFALNDYIFVNYSNIQPGTDLSDVDDKQFWVARVLEIRAKDEAHVYLRVFWLYWPEELPGGRQYYHGNRELVASNHMDIVDAMTVSGRADVKHWLELDEDEDLPDLFWRQKYDFVTKKIKDIRAHCRCHRCYNPDKIMFFCPHCRNWLHEECVIEQIQRNVVLRSSSSDDLPTEAPTTTITAVAETPSPPPVAKKRGRGEKSLVQSAVNSVAAALAATPKTSANIELASGSPSANGKGAPKPDVEKTKAEIEEEMELIEVTLVPTEGKDLKAIIKDNRSGSQVEEKKKSKKGTVENETVKTWEETVKCLICEGVVS